jgi:predicted DNA-binding ribbon-helix-helix protein
LCEVLEEIANQRQNSVNATSPDKGILFGAGARLLGRPNQLVNAIQRNVTNALAQSIQQTSTIRLQVLNFLKAINDYERNLIIANTPFAMTSAIGTAIDQEKLKQQLVQRFMESDNEDESVRSEKFFELLKWQRSFSGVTQESNSI